MKFLAICLIFTISLFAQEIKITAQKFEADEKKLISKFIGKVHLQKAQDEINASTLTITFDEKKHPILYEAKGNLSFQISTNDQLFIGHSDYLIYEPKTKKYQIVGNAFIHEKVADRKLYGEKIVIDRQSGKSQILGTSKKPVKIIFSIKE